MNVLLISFACNDNWESMSLIEAGIKKVYAEIEGSSLIEVSEKEIFMNLRYGGKYIQEIIEEVKKHSPDRIVFPNIPGNLFPFSRILLDFIPKDIELIFYINGSFMTFITNWNNLFKNIGQRKIKFVCLSRTQAKQISSLIEMRSGDIDYIPCYIPQIISSNSSASFEMSDKNFNIVYAGRISKQKNLEELLHVIDQHNKDMEVHLFIAGDYDELNDLTLGIPNGEMPFFDYFQNELSVLSKKTRSKIHFLGNLDQMQLHSLLEKVDAMVSLSTHHDECFGVSIAQAIYHSLPCLLTKWGGYKDFIGEYDSIEGVDIYLTDTGYDIDRDQIEEWLYRLSNKKAKVSLSKNHYLSFENIKSKTEVMLAKEPSLLVGLSDLGKKAISNKGKPLNFAHSQLYKEIYRSYFDSSS